MRASNPVIFGAPAAGTAYSRFGQGEMGVNLNNAFYAGKESTPEAQFNVAPGNPFPAAWNTNIGNQLGPGGKANANVAPPAGVQTEAQYAAGQGSTT